MCLRALMVVMFFVFFAMGEEPHCSRFHYEEQLLEKTIRMEIKFEELQRNFDRMTEETSKKFASITNEWTEEKATGSKKYDILKSDMESWQMQQDRNISALVATIQEEMSNTNKNSKSSAVPDILFKVKNPFDLPHKGNTTIVFTNTLYNYGGGYSSDTGVFTAPVAGVYLFTGQWCINMGLSYGIIVDGSEVTRGIIHAVGDICTSFDSIVKLSKSSTVYIQIVGSSSSRYRLHPESNGVNTFSGVFLH